MFGAQLRCQTCNQYTPDRCRCTVPPELFEQRKAQGYAPGGYLRKCGRCEGEFVGDKRAVCCKECADEAIEAAAATPPTEKPFPAPGKWFPTTVLGHPMREFAPGRWEHARWPSEEKLYRKVRVIRAFAYRSGPASPGTDYWYWHPEYNPGEYPPLGWFRIDYTERFEEVK